MKRRFMCIAMALLMLIPIALTGCQSTGTVTSTGSSATPYTITIWCITNDKTTQEGIEAAQEAINSITEYDFNTHIELRLFSAEEYEDEVRDALDTMYTYYEEPEETEAAQTYVNEDGEVVEETESKVYVPRDEIVYPKSTDYQCDILLVDSVDFYNELISLSEIQLLDGELLDHSKIISKFVNPTLLSAAKNSMDGGTYAIPNNAAVGEYEYVLLRKDLCDAYYYEPSDICTITQLNEFANDVATLNPGYTPILDTYGISPAAISLFGDDQSFFGSYVGFKPAFSTNAMPKVLGSVTKYQSELNTLGTMQSSGLLVKGDAESDTSNAACILVKGNSTVLNNYDVDRYDEDGNLVEGSYYVAQYKYPTATNDNTCSSMWAVSAYTKDLSRCMEIVTYMMTNYDFRNAFQYGKRDVNYTIDSKTDMVTILNDDYSMNPLYTGNQFILYQNDRMTEEELAFSADNWALAKKQNEELQASPYLGFSAAYTSVYFEDADAMTECTDYTVEKMYQGVKKIALEYQAKLDAYTGADKGTYAATLAEQMAQDPIVKAASNKKYTNSLFARYIAWYKMNNADEVVS